MLWEDVAAVRDKVRKRERESGTTKVGQRLDLQSRVRPHSFICRQQWCSTAAGKPATHRACGSIVSRFICVVLRWLAGRLCNRVLKRICISFFSSCYGC